jgi:ABC-type antimicrobial peptide transport system permease subunit
MVIVIVAPSSEVFRTGLDSGEMRRLVIAIAVVLLAAVAAYAIYVAIYASMTAEGYDASIFWTAIGLLFVIALLCRRRAASTGGTSQSRRS